MRAVQAVVLGGVAVGTLVVTDSPEAVPIVLAPLVLAFRRYPWERAHRCPGRGRRARPPHPSRPADPSEGEDPA